MCWPVVRMSWMRRTRGDVQSEECVDGITIHRVKPALIRPIRLLSVLLLYIPYCTRIPSACVREKGEESPNATVNAFGWIYCFLKRVPALVALGVKQTFAFLIQIGELVFRGIWYLVVLVATCIVAPFQFVYWLLKNRSGTRYRAPGQQRVERFLVFRKRSMTRLYALMGKIHKKFWRLVLVKPYKLGYRKIGSTSFGQCGLGVPRMGIA